MNVHVKQRQLEQEVGSISLLCVWQTRHEVALMSVFSDVHAAHSQEARKLCGPSFSGSGLQSNGEYEVEYGGIMGERGSSRAGTLQEFSWLERIGDFSSVFTPVEGCFGGSSISVVESSSSSSPLLPPPPDSVKV